MASSYTTRLRFEKQGIGENDATWGTKLNTVIDLIDEGADGYLAKSVAGASNVTLTSNNSAADESRQRALKFTGTLTGAIDVIVPAVEKHYVVWNATDGAFALTFKPSGGTGIVVPQGATGVVFTDGSTMYQAGNWNVASSVVATTSGATAAFTNLAGSVIRKIVFAVENVSPSDSNGEFEMVLGDSGGYETSGYTGGVSVISSVANTTLTTAHPGDAFQLSESIGAGTAMSGIITLVPVSGSSAQEWIMTSHLAAGNGQQMLAAGHKELTGALDRIKFQWSISSNFDAGSISILVE